MASSAPAARPLALTRAVPAWAWLTGIVVVSARAPLRVRALDDGAVDHGRRARLLGAREELRRDGALPDPRRGGRVVRVRLPAPDRAGVALFGSVPDAYAAAKAINAVVMSLAAVPAYFLARRVLSQWLSLAAALLTVAVPSMVYTGTLMTENAFYPIFLSAALALVLVLERPTRQRQLARARGRARRLRHARAGGRAVPGAPDRAAAARAPRLRPLPRPLRDGGRRRRRSRCVAEAPRGRSPLAVLGAYQTTSSEHYTPARWRSGRSATWPSSTSSSASIPFAALLVLCLEWRRLDRPQRAFLAGTGALALWLWLEVSAFASIPTVQRIEERNMFYVAPFFLIALLLWAQLGAPRRLPWAAVAALGSGALVAAIPFVRFIGLTATSDTFALLPWWKLQEHVITLQQVRPSRRPARSPPGALFLWSCRAATRSCCRSLVLVYFAARAAADRVADDARLARRALPGDPQRPTGLDRPRGRPQRGRGRDLDGQARRARDLGERVLQPQRRPDPRHGRRDPGRPAVDRGDDRPAHRPRPRRREARAPPLRARRLLARAEREGGRLGSRCSASRSTGWTGRCGR